MKKYIIFGLVLFGLSAGLALAQSPDFSYLLRLIGQLREQVMRLQAERQVKMPDPVLAGDYCYQFNRNLTVGSRGSDVYQLYRILYHHQTDNDANDYLDEYNSMLATWVSEFQEEYANEILKPLGLSRGTGHFGQSTRAALMRLYCKTPGRNQAPIIHNFEGPTRLELGEKGVWTITATDPEYDALTYKLEWGDEGNTSPVELSPRPTVLSAETRQRATFEHTYHKAGKYRLHVMVSDSVGNSTDKYLDIWVGAGPGANRPPTIGSISGPTSLSTRETGEWQIRAKDPEAGSLTYYVSWGDEPVYSTEGNSADESPRAAFQQNASFSHRYARPGIYTVQFSVMDDHDQTAKSSLTVQVI